MDSMHRCVDGYATKVGRILIGLLFLIAGIGSLLNFSMFRDMAATVLPMATAFAAIAIILKVGGGLSLILNIKTRLGSYALIFFTFMATLLFHVSGAFGGDQTQLLMALKNIAIIGGLLLVAKSSPIEGGMCMGRKCMGKKCEGTKCEGGKNEEEIVEK